jgi:hypothetical protein
MSGQDTILSYCLNKLKRVLQDWLEQAQAYVRTIYNLALLTEKAGGCSTGVAKVGVINQDNNDPQM